MNVPVAPPKCVGEYDFQMTLAGTLTRRCRMTSRTSAFQMSQMAYVRAPQLKRPYLRASYQLGRRD